jgi:basic amino acid/polyamine antiporter, APA family
MPACHKRTQLHLNLGDKLNRQSTREAPGNSKQVPRRRLGVAVLSCFGAATIFSAGVYVLIGVVIAEVGPAAPLAFLLALGLAMLTGLSYADLSAHYPEAAGPAIYVAEGLRSPRLGQLVGGAASLAAILAAASIARGSADYLAQAMLFKPWLVAIGIVVLLTAIACLDVRVGVGLVAVVTAVTLISLIFSVAAGAGNLSAFESKFAMLLSDTELNALNLTVATLLAFFAYTGFAPIVNFAEEAVDPSRTISRAIVVALALAGTLYTAVVIVALFALPPLVLTSGTAPIALVLTKFHWVPPQLLSNIVLFATANGVLVELLMVGRLLYGMAHRGWAPQIFAAIAPRTHTPVHATIAAGACTLVLAALIPFEALAPVTSALFLLIFGFVNLALFCLRTRGRCHHPRRYAPTWMALLASILSFALIAVVFASWFAS